MNKTVVAVAAILTAGAVAVWALGSAREGSAESDLHGDAVVIGTGVVTGLYFPAGGAICRMLNQGRDVHGLRCSVEATAGSVANINALRGGEIDLAIVQSDWQNYAVNGTGSFKSVGAFDDLRALFSIHSEAFNILVRRDAKLRQFADLKGKRINVGPAGSGQRAMFEDAMAAFDLAAKDFAQVSDLRAGEQIKALCERKIDAAVIVLAHPNGAIQEAAATCDLALVEVTGPGLERLIEDHPFYAPVTVLGGLYERLPQDTRTFGLKATLVASDQLGDELVYQIVRALFDNFEEFRSLHPAFAALDPRAMAGEANSAPLHAGAERYFREKGWL
jgi:TRAP transporter TAXI family solute receptor